MTEVAALGAMAPLAIPCLAALVAAAGIHAPLVVRLVRLTRLRRSAEAAFADTERPPGARRYEVDAAFRHSPLAPQWEEFLRRWWDSRTPGDEEGRAPARLQDVFLDRPVLPAGARQALLPAVPGILLAAGALGAFAGLALGIAGLERGVEAGVRDLADWSPLSGVVWSGVAGLGFGLAAAVAGRWIEGSAASCADALDGLAARVYAPMSSAELAIRSAGALREATDLLRDDLTRVLDAGLQRIESSTAAAASLVSDEQRDGLRKVVEVLTDEVTRGVREQVDGLRGALDRTAQHQEDVAQGLGKAFDRMNHAAATHRRLTEALEKAVERLGQASGAVSSAADAFQPVTEQLRDTGSALERTTHDLGSTQEGARAALGVLRASLDASATAAREQRELVDGSLQTMRDALTGLRDGVSQELEQGLLAVDAAVARAATLLSQGADRSRETLEHVAEPLASASEVAREFRSAAGALVDQVRQILEALEAREPQGPRAALPQAGAAAEPRSLGWRDAGSGRGRAAVAGAAAHASDGATRDHPAPPPDPERAALAKAASDAKAAPPKRGTDGGPAQGGDAVGDRGLSQLLHARRPDEPASLRAADAERRKRLDDAKSSTGEPD